MSDLIELPREALARAGELLARAYAPYSKFRVASVIKARGEGRLFGGCNVENASLGATICAERSAIVQMVAACGRSTLEWVLVMVEGERPVPPCGMCLQMIAEFGGDDVPIYLANRAGIKRIMRLSEALPHAFRAF